MLYIAICDDEAMVVKEVSKILSDYCKNKSIDFKISEYCDGLDLMISQENFDIIFLDIEMSHSNGIETAQKIRECDMNVPIVYITSYVDYWRMAFKVHAFGFITKPFNKNEFYDVMDDYFTAIHDASEETITLPTEDGVVCFKLNEIYYFMFEAKKKIYVYTNSSRVLVRENLNDIYERLDKTQFYQTRRDCIVSLKYVQKLKNEFVIVMKDGAVLPLAQKKKKEFMEKLSKEFVKKLKGRNI